MGDTYFRMNDALPEHRKIVSAGGDAGWLHVCALAYASRNLTDGFVPASMVPRLSDRKQPAKLAKRLVEVGLWHTAGHACPRCPQPAEGDYLIHDYLLHQRSAAKVEEIKAKRALAGQRGGLKKASNARAGGKASGKQAPSNLLAPQAVASAPSTVTNESTPASNKENFQAPSDPEAARTKPPKANVGAGEGADVSSDLLDGWQPSVVANATPDTETEVVLRTTHKPFPPTGGADAQRHADIVPIGEPTITQRSKKLTDAYYAAEPMCNWNGVNQIVIKAIKANKWTDQEIHDALLRLAADNRGVSVEKLRYELAPPAPSGRSSPPQPPRSTTDERVEQAQRLKAEFAAMQQPPTIRGEVAR